MGVSGKRHAPTALLPPEKGPPVPIVQEAGWAPEPVWTQRLGKKILCPRRGSNPDRPVVQPVVRHYTAWANPAPTTFCMLTNPWSQTSAADTRNSSYAQCSRFLTGRLKDHEGRFPGLSVNSTSAVCLPARLGQQVFLWPDTRHGEVMGSSQQC
jgi:hypothetical protein